MLSVQAQNAYQVHLCSPKESYFHLSRTGLARNSRIAHNDFWIFFQYEMTGGVIVAYFKLFLSVGIKACLVLVAFAEAVLIYMTDFSGYMFDVVILTLALGMTVFCLLRAIRNYTADVKELGL